MESILLKDLLEAGCHFGHQVNRWHPKAKAFIYQARDGIHIINLAKTKESMERVATYVKGIGEKGGTILFVATKRQAKGVVSQEAKRVGLPYLTQRWIGGFLTNWEEVKKNLDRLNKMRSDRSSGAWKVFPKHEQVALKKSVRKLEGFYGGVADLSDLPDALFIVDIKKEEVALREAIKRSIPIIAIVDTNSDHSKVDYPVPANDDAVGSIKYITTYIASAYAEGRAQGEKNTEEDRSEKVEKKSKEKVGRKGKEKTIRKKIASKKSTRAKKD